MILQAVAGACLVLAGLVGVALQELGQVVTLWHVGAMTLTMFGAWCYGVLYAQQVLDDSDNADKPTR